MTAPAYFGRAPDPNVPWWCGISDWTGGWAKDCRPPTEAEIRAGQQAGIGPAMTSENIAAALAAGDAAVASYCSEHAAECAAYRDTVSESSTPWGLLIMGAAVVLVLVLR